MISKTKFTLLVLLLFYCLQSIAQENNLSIAKKNLSGKWKAYCGVEYVDKATIRNCELCPFIIDPNDKSLGMVKDIEMIFKNDSILLNRNGEFKTIAYSLDEETHQFGFFYINKEYLFRVFYIEDNIILEDGDGLVLLLDRIK